ncbi:MAG: DMT family transporter [Coriobacteriales bacterium]|jgi:drug/metabolite transporter (DMT)-like permease|nr:DMT family transporter [Coriobacteriales bacterium]
MPKTLTYALMVFAGGWCYGIMVPLVRVAHTMGYDSTQIMMAQYLVGVCALGVAVIFFSRRSVGVIQVLKLAGVGVVAAGVSFGYYNALALLSSAAALTLLFQFVWMGVLLQAVLERALPNRLTVLSVILVLLGTVLAAGILEWDSSPLNPLGVFFGILSAVCYTAFLHLSGRVATELPTINRTFFTGIGSLITSFFLAPIVIADSAVLWESSWIAIPLALVGIVAPILLIQKGAPKLPSGMTTIMASSELPSGILMGALFVGDPIGFLEICGVIIILGGIVLSQVTLLRTPQPTPQPKDPEKP